jgi:hypothetical protein
MSGKPKKLTDGQQTIIDRDAAFRDLETHTANTWKSKFQKQLALAASYLPSTRPQTQEDRAAVKNLIKSLTKFLRGRIHEKAHIPSGVERTPAVRAKQAAAKRAAAEDIAAHLLRTRKQLWCKENGRQRAPAWKTAELTPQVIKQISIQCSVPAAQIRAYEVRKLANKK